MTITGEPGRGPMRVGIPINDLTAGNLLAMGIMMKLYDRERTGKGGYVHTSLLEAQVFMLDFQASRYLMDGEVAGQAGNDHPVNIPMGVFPTTDKPINIAASSPKLWTNFCKAAGREEWLEVDGMEDQRRPQQGPRSGSTRSIAEVTKHAVRPNTGSTSWRKPASPAARSTTSREVFEDPQVKHLEMAMPMQHRTRGDIKVVAPAGEHRGLSRPASTGTCRNSASTTRKSWRKPGSPRSEIEELKQNGALGGA